MICVCIYMRDAELTLPIYIYYHPKVQKSPTPRTPPIHTQALSAPAVLLNALAVGALRGFLDTTTPVFVVLAAFLLDYSLQPQWFAWMLPKKGKKKRTLRFVWVNPPTQQTSEPRWPPPLTINANPHQQP